MGGQSNNLDAKLFAKINRILDQQKNNQEQEKLTPKEFLHYLILHQKFEGDYVAISRGEFSEKVNGRDAYITEILADKDQIGVPQLLAYQLAAMTGKAPAFFFKEFYGIEEAEGVVIDMSKDITHVTQFMSRDKPGRQPRNPPPP